MSRMTILMKILSDDLTENFKSERQQLNLCNTHPNRQLGKQKACFSSDDDDDDDDVDRKWWTLEDKRKGREENEQSKLCTSHIKLIAIAQEEGHGL